MKLLILRISKAIGIFRLTRLLARRKLLILCYHGFELTDETAFRPRLFMQSKVFAGRLEAIRRSGSPVLPLDEAVQRLHNGTLPDNAVCLTIDDGFHSVLKCAAPLLDRYKYPATLYVTSYYIEKAAPIFRLVVQYMLWKTTVDELDVADQPWGLDQPVDMTSAKNKDYATWTIIEYGETRCDEPGRQRISKLLGDRLQIDYAGLVQSRIVSLLTPDELKQLGDFGIDVQLHTHRHRFPVDDEATVRAEIAENADFLQGVLGRSLTHFCYPSGIWDRRQWPWLTGAGIENATTCDPSLNTPDTPALGLYRVVDANDVSPIEFEAELYGFSEFVRLITGRRKSLDLAR